MGADAVTTTPMGGLVMDRAGSNPDHCGLQTKIGLVLRLLRGESIEVISLESHIPVRYLESWEHQFLDAGQHGLQSGNEDPREPPPRSTLARPSFLAGTTFLCLSPSRIHRPPRGQRAHGKWTPAIIPSGERLLFCCNELSAVHPPNRFDR